MKILNQKGTVLLFAVVAITAIAVLGTGIYFMTTTSTFSGLGMNDQNRAYQLALAGKDYALTKNLGNTASLYPGGRTFTFANGDKFRLVISGDTIISTGIVKEGTPYEAKRTISVTITGFSSQAGISFAKDIAAMGIIQPTGAPGAFISKTGSSLSLGKIGAAYGGQFGAVVYNGNAVQGNCVTGKCEFGTGFNAFFVFQFAPGSTGDGFTFAFFNGSNNNANSVGGYSGSGELMGYAGDSYVSSGYYLDGQGGRGIQPPKVAVEFDSYANGCAASACSSDSRCDESDPDPSHNYKNHMALMFWGYNTPCGLGSILGGVTFDDNRHGAGGGSNESISNALNPSQSSFEKCHYFDGNNACSGTLLGWPGNWLLNTALPNIYAFRIEVRRKLTPELSGDYQYTLKGWIKRCDSGDPTCTTDYAEGADYPNTKQDYTAANPTLDRTIEISSDYHQKFEKMLFGWTTATSSNTQSVNINRFKMTFLK